MRKWSRALLPVLFGVAGAVAAQATDYRAQYAEQWPLSLSSAQSGAYRVVLEPAIYRRAGAADLGDLQVFNAAGQALPSALLAPDQPLAQPPVQRELPWFALPPLAEAQRNDLQLLTERDTDGRVRRVEARLGGGAVANGQGGWLIDASVLGQQPLAALVLDWAESGQPLQAQVQLDASDDLQRWQSIARDVPLVDLQRAGKRLLQRRLQVDSNVRYLRILPQGEARLPELRSVLAELPPAPATVPWEWLSLTPTAQGKGEFTFELDGRFPATRADVASTDNSLVQWTLFSRDDESAEWQRRSAPWIAHQLPAIGGTAVGRHVPRPLLEAGREPGGDHQRPDPAPGLSTGGDGVPQPGRSALRAGRGQYDRAPRGGADHGADRGTAAAQ
jgi:hypothetical protein